MQVMRGIGHYTENKGAVKERSNGMPVALRTLTVMSSVELGHGSL